MGCNDDDDDGDEDDLLEYSWVCGCAWSALHTDLFVDWPDHHKHKPTQISRLQRAMYSNAVLAQKSSCWMRFRVFLPSHFPWTRDDWVKVVDT